MKKILLPFLLLFSLSMYSQNDCTDAITVCGNNNFSDLNATGIGIQELNDSNNCDSQEHNSLWFKVNIKTGGTFGFTLTPTLADGSINTDLNVDFDFFVFGPNATCDDLGTSIRCSTTNPVAALQSHNLTGMNDISQDASEGPAERGDSFVNWIVANDNDSYFIVIDRPIGNSNFKLDWTGNATFWDQPSIANPVNGTNYNLEGYGLNAISFFDLTINESNMLNGQTDIAISYHNSNNDVLTNTNAIINPDNFQNTISPQEIFVRFTNTKTQCFNTTSFKLLLEDKPIPYIICDDTISGSDTDGISLFLLNTRDSEILGTLNNANYSVSYHTTLIGAETNNSTDVINKNSNYAVNGSQTVYIRVEETGGGYLEGGIPLELIVNDLPIIDDLFTLNQCDNNPDKQTTFNLTLFNENITNNYTFKYFATEADAIAGTNHVIDPTSYFVDTTGEAWVKTISDQSCYRISKIELFVSYTPNEPYEDTFFACDDFLDIKGNNTIANSETDGITFFDFSIAPSKITTDPDIQIDFYENENHRTKSLNKINDISKYRNSNIPNTTDTAIPIYYKLISKTNNDCIGLGQIFLKINSLPEFEVESPYTLCLNELPLTISSHSPKDTYTYNWTNENGDLLNSNTSDKLEISEAGTYYVTAFTTDSVSCSKTKSILVNEYDVITITEDDIEVTDDSNGNPNSMSINITGAEIVLNQYEFALQDEEGRIIRNFQDETLFKNLEGGIYTLIVRHKLLCTPDVKLIISVIQFTKFFTPNNDNFNDTWTIKGANESFYPKSLIYIFNRFGTLVAKTKITEGGWDGNYNGKPLPPNDYWYKVILTPPADSNKKNIIKTGHFSLLRK